jgi:hypothetical protein
MVTKFITDTYEEQGISRHTDSSFMLDYRRLELGDTPMRNLTKLNHAESKSKKAVECVQVPNSMFMETFWTALDVLNIETTIMRYMQIAW